MQYSATRRFVKCNVMKLLHVHVHVCEIQSYSKLRGNLSMSKERSVLLEMFISTEKLQIHFYFQTKLNMFICDHRRC